MKVKKLIFAALACLLAAACAGAGFFIGRSNGCSALTDERQFLREMNRASIENMIIGETPIFVIGHRSPDSDTVCSAIAYAKLLSALGYDAQAAITQSVNKESAYILQRAGVEVPPVLEDAAGKSIFLVDHSEYMQAAEGMEDAAIVGVIDHHGVGSVTTGQQVVYEARPIGATATIIWLDYLNYGVDIDRATACLLLGAVLSDTDNLTSTTVTAADKRAVPALAKIAGIGDVDAFYRALHAEKLSYEGMSDQDILFSDYKEYEVKGVKFGIGTVQAIDEEAAKNLAGRMKAALPEGFKTRDVSLLYAQITVRENGVKMDYIVPCDENAKKVFEAAFPDVSEFDSTAFISRTGMGRKSVLVPGFTDYLSAYPHE